ncbi:MAG: hypothetical protein LH609_07580 [Rudanella sp.]|jgi:hypothetical protein|nr:hypothetical protein [Rudanella sp.]
MDKQQAVDLFLVKLADWENASKPDAYTYEKSFEQFIQSLSSDLLQLSVGPLAQDRNTKKK